VPVGTENRCGLVDKRSGDESVPQLMSQRRRPHKIRVDFAVSNQKTRDEGGRDADLGCDRHARQQTTAMVDTESGEFTEKMLTHEGNAVRKFYAALEGGEVVGIEATGATQWFLELLEELGIEYRVGHPAKIRAKETRNQKHGSARCRVAFRVAGRGSVSGDLDALERTMRLVNPAAGSPSVVEDAIALATHPASDRTQSRLATRSWPVECRGASQTASLAIAALHRSTAK